MTLTCWDCLCPWICSGEVEGGRCLRCNSPSEALPWATGNDIALSRFRDMPKSVACFRTGDPLGTGRGIFVVGLSRANFLGLYSLFRGLSFSLSGPVMVTVFFNGGDSSSDDSSPPLTHTSISVSVSALLSVAIIISMTSFSFPPLLAIGDAVCRIEFLAVIVFPVTVAIGGQIASSPALGSSSSGYMQPSYCGIRNQAPGLRFQAQPSPWQWKSAMAAVALLRVRVSNHQKE
ncbi:hypothetical protein RRF57_010251 [Xylaria bambusicola]|uniref:Uncharacterized protein n=1 Tax=Xylaria bambusicola TaxID=326684 RepID=A0AAN7UUP4_9PEZI